MTININNLDAIKKRIADQGDNITTEEATKTALIMPLLNLLGYDVFNPSEVIPEFNADIGRKNAEKVDFAILRDGEVTILIEAKQLGTKLDDNKASQLRRYFNATPTARFGVLTNGEEYYFYSDIDNKNIMDDIPFFRFNLSNYDEPDITELSKFLKDHFDVSSIMETANDLKYRSAIEEKIREEFNDPSDELVKLFSSSAYSGQWRQSAIDKFSPLVIKAWKQFLRDALNDKIKKAFDGSQSPDETPPPPENNNTSEQTEEENIITTQEEIDGFNIVRAIASEIIDPSRIFMRDRQSYCGVLVDDNNRKPLARLHFNRATKYIGIFDDEEKKEEKIQIENLTDIFQLSERIKNTASKYT